MKRDYIVFYNLCGKNYYMGHINDVINVFGWTVDINKAKLYKTGSEALKVRDELYEHFLRSDPSWVSYNKHLDITSINRKPVKDTKPKPVKTFHKINHNRFSRLP